MLNRGILQGDPILPYIFVLCMERLAHIIKDFVRQGMWKLLKFGRAGTKLSHIFFADDMVLFGESSDNRMDMMLDCLNTFFKALGPRVSI